MLEIKQDNKKFVEEVDILSDIYSRAFAGYPWFEDVPFELAKERLLVSTQGRGFKAFLALLDSQIVGASWFDTPTPLELIQRGRSDGLLTFILDKMRLLNLGSLVYIRDTLVNPEHQGKGIATALKSYYLSYIRENFDGGVLVLTRHREDNIAIMKSSRRLGFQPTGIRIPTSADPKIYHEYWDMVQRVVNNQ